MNWREHFSQKIVVEEYYIIMRTQYDSLTFKIHYVKHNGYTYMEHSPGFDFGKEQGDEAKEFLEWVRFRSDILTRCDRPHWWKPIRFKRKKKLVIWGVKSLQKAYNEFYQERVAIK